MTASTPDVTPVLAVTIGGATHGGSIKATFLGTVTPPGHSEARRSRRGESPQRPHIERTPRTPPTAVLVERTNRTDTDVKQLRTDMEKAIGDLKAEVAELKKGRWPIAQIGALVAVGGLIAAVIALFVN